MNRGHKKEYFNVMYTSYKNRHANRDTLMCVFKISDVQKRFWRTKVVPFKFGKSLKYNKILKVKNHIPHTWISNLWYLIKHKNQKKCCTQIAFTTLI